MAVDRTDDAMTNVLDEPPDAIEHTVEHTVDDDPAHDPARPRSLAPAVAVLAALLLAGLVAAGFLGSRVLAAQKEDRSRAQALHAARQLVADFTTVDYRKFDRQSGDVLNLASGDFRSQYSHAAKQLRTLVTQNRTVSRGQILEAGIASFDQDSARVLVVADAQVKHVGADKPELRTYRLQLDLSREKAGWRVVELQFVG
ncbi:hypothetical protein [Actinopolymorpha rutila]|uniref:Mce-associated membrane protein n=1 Tax=Actinopolymorpha rutila TaxID=446787 RepID=A0A852ZR45_9ACTN|nr:hypothetical protein [Actinopolymorpha rutila]NYH91869.1 Mce-associated membrane protein [Actinopolymorpha rutila]